MESPLSHLARSGCVTGLRLVGCWGILASCLAASPAALRWETLPSLPDREGFAGAFAGVSGGALIVAGGANFPEAKPWQGGRKVWHDRVFVLEAPGGSWSVAGRLPHPLGYGVSASWKGAVVCAGGSEADRHRRDVFTLRYAAGVIALHSLPELPIALADAAGALVEDQLLICGGSEGPGMATGRARLFSLDLSQPATGWHELASCPGPGRILAAAAGLEGTFVLLGGASLSLVEDKIQRTYLQDGWAYRPDEGWRRLPDLPTPCAAAPSPAPVSGSRCYLLGGDDGSRAGLGAVADHPGFPGGIQVFDLHANTWAEAGTHPAPRVTLPVVGWKGRWVFPSGESRPGVRSPEVRTLTINP
ncbi:MAG: galactose oxidase [Verrucomicrobiales bacterium]|nr:galactose oxidase [Verrucomicrobiales bacterium]